MIEQSSNLRWHHYNVGNITRLDLLNRAPGYYCIVFEDPDGIRLEVNYVPGKGLLTGDNPIMLNMMCLPSSTF